MPDNPPTLYDNDSLMNSNRNRETIYIPQKIDFNLVKFKYN